MQPRPPESPTFMFTSRPFEPRTVLLWGDRWYFPDREASEPFQHVVHAAEMLADEFAGEPKPVKLRLLYQPDALESVGVACPQGNRRVLTLALAGEYPVLDQPDHAWSHEPILPLHDGYSTVLHFEREPALVALSAQLARLGLAVDSAWPLVTFLHALPEEWTDSGAVTAVAVRAEAAVAYHHPKDGPRSVLAWHGATAVADAGQWVAAALADHPNESIRVVCTDDTAVDTFNACVGHAERTGLETIRLSEALGRRVVLPRYHPAQLLPREPLVSAQRCAMAAGIALLLAAGWAGFAYGRDWFAIRAEVAARHAKLAAVRTEAAHLRQNAVEIAGLRSLVEGGTAGPPGGALLRKLSTLPPQEIALSTFRLEGRVFELTGWIAPEAPAGLLERWRQSVAPPDAAWTLDVRGTGGGGFAARGTFLP